MLQAIFTGNAIPLICLLILLSLCVTVGLLPTAAAKRGPVVLMLWGSLVASIALISSAAMAAAIWDAQWGDTCTGPAIVGLLAFASALVCPIYALVTGHKQADHHRFMAPLVKKFMLERFDEINRGRDGTITDEEMRAAVMVMHLTDEESALLSYARFEQSDLGHVIHSYFTNRSVLIPVGKVLVPTVQRVEEYIYGIDRRDIDTYPDRVLDEFKNW